MHVGAFSLLCLSLTGCHCNMHHCPQSVGSVPSGIGGLDFNRLWLSRKIETNGYRHPTARSQCLTYLQMENSFNKSAPSILNTTTFCGGRFSQWCMVAPFKKMRDACLPSLLNGFSLPRNPPSIHGIHNQWRMHGVLPFLWTNMMVSSLPPFFPLPEETFLWT